ncbi:MAG: hypothetical protein WBD95_19410 [Xanthobacteraceae bacterium]
MRKNKFAILENSVARRKPLTKRQWYSFETDKGLTVEGSGGPDRDALAISFVLPGGRKPEDTEIEIAIKSNDFRAVMRCMSSTDRDAALKAMAEEMRDQLCGNSK